MASWKIIMFNRRYNFLGYVHCHVSFHSFAGAHRSVKDILKYSRIVFEGAISRDQSDRKTQPMVVQQGNFLQTYIQPLNSETTKIHLTCWKWSMYPQKLFHPTEKNQNTGGSFRQEFFLRDLTANLLFSSSDVSCSPGENSTRKGKDRCCCSKWATKKGPPWLFRVYRGWKTTQLCRDYFIKHYQDPYETARISHGK